MQVCWGCANCGSVLQNAHLILDLVSLPMHLGKLRTMFLMTILKSGADPVLVFSSKLVAVASLLDRQGPFYQTSDSPEKNSTKNQPKSVSKKKRRQHPAGSGKHHAVLHTNKLSR